MDARSAVGPWTLEVLRMIGATPGKRAADLAAEMNWETAQFKAHVRRLKALGLTESLEVGYRLSPRARSLLDVMPR
jgi:DNA-binding IclR family transcriptional regulator